MALTLKADDSSVRILLYVVVPGTLQNTPIVRSRLASVRNRTRRALDLEVWRLRGTWAAHFSTFEDRTHSNRGDMAIRMGLRQELARAFAPRPVEFVEVEWGELSEALVEQVHLVVFGGSGYIHPDAAGRLPPRFLSDLDVLEKTSTPVVAASIGLNSNIDTAVAGGQPFADDQAALLRRFLQRLSLVSVRDRIACGTLHAATGETPQVVIDPAFLLGIELGAKPSQIADQPVGRPLRVGLNIAFHSSFPSRMTHTFLPAFVRALKDFRARHPCRFTYFVHSDGERAIARALDLAGIDLEIVDTGIEGMFAAYRGLDLHVAQMLHSTIFSMSQGIPTLSLPYDVKSVAFFSLLGLRDVCIDARNLDHVGITAALEMLLERRPAIALKLAETAPQFIATARDFYRQIPDVVIREEQVASKLAAAG